MQAEAQRRGIPVQALGMLAQIGIPIAALGSQSSGTATGTKTDSPLTQALQVGGIFKSFFPGGL
jgi:hypothetical protein